MTNLPVLRLKKNEDRRLRAGHLWVYSNEIDTKYTTFKDLPAGCEVQIESADKKKLGMATVNPHSLIVARLFSRSPHDRLDLSFFEKKILDAYRFRQSFFNKPFYRLIFAEGDHLSGLIVDRFDDTLVVQTNTAGMEMKKQIITEALLRVIPEIKHILFKNDSQSRLIEKLPIEVVVGFGSPPATLMIEENNSLFDIPLWEGQKTGWFYDHRANRLRLKDYVDNASVLDVFSYLGAWGIQALKSGANHVTCIDSSSLAMNYIQKNAKLNAIENGIETIQQDAFIALKALATEKKKYDVIIVDPPAFVKKLKDKKEGLVAYQRLNEFALTLLNPSGFLISCSCSMHISYDDLIQVIRRSGMKLNMSLQLIERGHQAQDHPIHLAIPETDYLKMLVIRKA